MAMITMVVQDTPAGAVVSVATEPIADLSAPDRTEAQHMAFLMLNALPAKEPAEQPAAG